MDIECTQIIHTVRTDGEPKIIMPPATAVAVASKQHILNKTHRGYWRDMQTEVKQIMGGSTCLTEFFILGETPEDMDTKNQVYLLGTLLLITENMIKCYRKM